LEVLASLKIWVVVSCKMLQKFQNDHVFECFPFIDFLLLGMKCKELKHVVGGKCLYFAKYFYDFNKKLALHYVNINIIFDINVAKMNSKCNLRVKWCVVEKVYMSWKSFW